MYTVCPRKKETGFHSKISVHLPSYEDAIPEGRRRVYLAQGFQHNPSYVNSDQSTEAFGRRRSPMANISNKDIIPDKFAGKIMIPWSDYILKCVCS